MIVGFRIIEIPTEPLILFKILHRIFKYLLFFIFGVANAQHYTFDHLTDRDGLVNNSVTSIIKDSEGFMWFGTMNGLSRYDGYSFTQFMHEPDNLHSMKDNYVRCIIEAKNKKIYISFRSHGFCIFNKDSETFENFDHNENNINSLGSNNVSCIYEDKAGNIWIGTSKGLDKFNYSTKKFEHYFPFAHNEHGFVTSISEDEQGCLWLYGMGTSLCKLDPKNNVFSYLKFSSSTSLNAIFLLGGKVIFDSKHNLWIGNELDGLCKYNLKTGNIERFSVSNGKLKSNVILFISEDHKKNIWIGTDGAGLYKYSYATDSLENIPSNADDPNGLSGAAVYCLYESEQNILWFGTYAGGINIWKKNIEKFSLINNEGLVGKKLNAKSVLVIVDANKDNLWLGLNGGGLSFFNRKTLDVKSYTEENSALCGGIVKVVSVDADSNIWCGTYGNGLCKLNLKNGDFQNFRQDVIGSNKTIDRNHVWSIFQAGNKMWIGTLTGGINVYDFKSKTFQHHPLEKEFNIKPKDITKILKDSKNRQWFGSEVDGAYCYDSSQGTLINLKRNNINTNFPSNDVRDIFEDSKGNIWFATQKGGLAKYENLDYKKIKNYTIKEGLPSNNIRKILEDKHGNLWISTDKGISCFNVAHNTFKNFDIDDGLQGNEYCPNSGHQTSDGYMYFGGIDGMNFFHPDSIKYNTVQPKLSFTNFKIFNQSIKPNFSYNGNVYLNKSIIKTNEIVLDYESYAFTIEFAALTYSSPYKNMYSYKLEGFDDEWVETSAANRFATYTNLDPGEYIFRVKASNNDGVWNNNGIFLKIKITPPWWMTWIFRLCTIVLCITIGTLFFYWRLKNISQQYINLENEVKRRTLELIQKNEEIVSQRIELELNNSDISLTNERILIQQENIIKQKEALEQSNKTKDKFFSIIAHDLRNPVTALTFLIEQLKYETIKLNEPNYQGLVVKVEDLANHIQRLVMNLLEWARTQSANVSVDLKNFNISDLIPDVISIVKNDADLKKISIEFLDDDPIIIFGDKKMIGIILKNILSNAIKFTDSMGVIKVRIFQNLEYTVISVQDNGIGMTPETQKKLFKIDESFSTLGTNNETGTGLGLLIAHELVIINKGKIAVESEIKCGSTFFIYLSNFQEV